MIEALFFSANILSCILDGWKKVESHFFKRYTDLFIDIREEERISFL